ncbi:MAG: Transcriptional regulator, AcrR family, partial [uncultured Rubrobacteraceae bacterium]
GTLGAGRAPQDARGGIGALRRAWVRADHSGRGSRARRPHGAHLLPALPGQAGGAVCGRRAARSPRRHGRRRARGGGARRGGRRRPRHRGRRAPGPPRGRSAAGPDHRGARRAPGARAHEARLLVGRARGGPARAGRVKARRKAPGRGLRRGLPRRLPALARRGARAWARRDRPRSLRRVGRPLRAHRAGTTHPFPRKRGGHSSPQRPV